MSTIYTHIDQNKRTTKLVVFFFILFVSLVVWLLGELYFDGSGFLLMGIAIIISSATSFISYYNSDKIVLSLSNAKELDPVHGQYLYRLVENLCIGAGLPMPKIYIIDDPAMNAFATGRDPEHAVVVFTTGIVNNLTKLELEGVIAHELSHIGNYDIRLMSIVGVLVGSILILTDMISRFFFFGNDRDNRLGVVGLAALLITIILSPLVAMAIKMAISRNREYLADASGALLTRYPDGLASALEKLSQEKYQLASASGVTAHMYISNPFKKGSLRSSVGNLFNTHPPIEERIKRLREM